ncbi:bcl-2-like protein 15 isoform X2 [Microcaecilia unicolor]|uniref:Bcl-2-like protein 15 isoform X2 n=1 Tax=Microcaecilia unicolor TaxID=1415580 RepID=A0A6P7ZDC0_9AMPH|nr:bcl-2-like protein 15 isoform X2 [Microcaecilia unicolor]
MRTFEEETECVVKALLSELLGENEGISFRNLESDSLESSEGNEDTFDPQLIACRLRDIGDRINKEIERNVQQLILDWGTEKVAVDFLKAVSTVSSTWTARNPEVASEKALLSVGVALFKQTVIRAPQLCGQLESAMNTFFSTLKPHIQNLGGWEHI